MEAMDVLTEVPNVYHPLLTQWEQQFDATPYRRWMQANWALSIPLAITYVLVIFAIQGYKARRPPANLRAALGVWSAVLAVFSILGTLRTLPDLLTMVRTHGLHFSMCNPSFYQGPTGFWVMLYTFSKAYELGDTLFIVLRKQKLIFLHWYHHLVTLVYMSFAYKEFIALARWGITINFMVHAFMYSYYALRAFRVRVPRAVNVFITSIQLVQMVIGVIMTTYSFYLLKENTPCQQTLPNNIFSSIMYASYLALFANFFYKTYVNKNK